MSYFLSSDDEEDDVEEQNDFFTVPYDATDDHEYNENYGSLGDEIQDNLTLLISQVNQLTQQWLRRSAPSNGLTKVQLDGLSSVRRLTGPDLSSKTVEQCPICLTDYEIGEEIRTLPCWHLYHCECIDRWMKDHNTCPVCKADIKALAEEAETLSAPHRTTAQPSKARLSQSSADRSPSSESTGCASSSTAHLPKANHCPSGNGARSSTEPSQSSTMQPSFPFPLPWQTSTSQNEALTVTQMAPQVRQHSTGDSSSPASSFASSDHAPLSPTNGFSSSPSNFASSNPFSTTSHTIFPFLPPAPVPSPATRSHIPAVHLLAERHCNSAWRNGQSTFNSGSTEASGISVGSTLPAEQYPRNVAADPEAPTAMRMWPPDEVPHLSQMLLQPSSVDDASDPMDLDN